MMETQDYHMEGPKNQDQIRKQNKLVTPDTNASGTNRKHLQLCAWLLLALGLLITLLIFYLVIIRTPRNKDVIPISGNVSNSRPSLADFGDMAEDLLDTDPFVSEENEDEQGKEQNFNGSERLTGRCKEKSCNIVCTGVSDIFTVLYDTIKKSLCSSIHKLLLENVNIPKGVILSHNWPPVRSSISQVNIRLTERASITNAAFNMSALFHNTTMLNLHSINIIIIESRSLLGFKSLKYLTIESQLNDFPRHLLQPVEDSLLQFKLNGYLNIRGSENLFDGSFLYNLAYLQLSQTVFSGSLGKEFFNSTPNLKYLIISDSQLQHIATNAFENLADKLIYLDLAKNRLTTLAAEVLEPILLSHNKVNIKLADNDWLCDCQLKELAGLYRNHIEQFENELQCKAPQHLYGSLLDEVDFDLENCLSQELQLEKNKSTAVMAKVGQNAKVLPRCLHELEYTHKLKPSGNIRRQVGPVRDRVVPDHAYELDLQLIAENNRVEVTVSKPDESCLIMWFSEKQESAVVSYAGKNLDYECLQYVGPHLIVGPLQDNTTYTFCVLSSVRYFSPFGCQPLHVPPLKNQTISISDDNKRLTIGMVCLTFLLSAFAGAIFAVIGIAYFADAVESSTKAVALKKPDQPYVATISEMEYQKQASLRNSSKWPPLPLPRAPSLDTTLAEPVSILVKDLERILSTSLVSKDADCTIASCSSITDGYEKPKAYSDERKVEIPDCISPNFPPPLPMSNSDISNNSTVVSKRLSKNGKLL